MHSWVCTHRLHLTQRTIEGVRDMMQVVAEAVTTPLTLFFSPPLSMHLIAKHHDLNSNLRHWDHVTYASDTLLRCCPTASTSHSSIFSPVCSCRGWVWSDVQTKRSSSSGDRGRRVALSFLLFIKNGLLTHNQIVVCDNVIYVLLNETCCQCQFCHVKYL